MGDSANMVDMTAYALGDDLVLIQELLGCTQQELASELGVSVMTLNRWQRGVVRPNRDNMELLYSFAFKKGLRLNRIKEQLFSEMLQSHDAFGVVQGADAACGEGALQGEGGRMGACSRKLLFHGAKGVLEGAPSLAFSKRSNDFGPGFYCGERLEQAAMFVAGYPEASLYLFAFDPAGLHVEEYGVDGDWMLTVALFRGMLKDYEGHPSLAALRQRAEGADCLVAPIADNRIFQLIDEFAQGEITDVQCQHCLSATSLGRQFVFKSQKALEKLSFLEHCFLPACEKEAYELAHAESVQVGADKVKAAKRLFRREGRYIEELLS